MQMGAMFLRFRVSQLTHLILGPLGVFVAATLHSAWAKPLIDADSSSPEFEEAQKQLQAAHQDYFHGLNSYYEALSSRNPDPAKVKLAEDRLEQVEGRITEIKTANLQNTMNLINSSVILRHEDGTVTLKKKSEVPEAMEESDDESSPAEKPIIGETQAVTRSQPESALEFPQDIEPQKTSLTPEPTPTSPPVEAPSIDNAEGPRDFVFKKKKKPASPDSSRPVSR